MTNFLVTLRVPFAWVLTCAIAPGFLKAQGWSPWVTTATFSKDREGYESFRTLSGLDSKNRKWSVEWTGGRVVIDGPGGVCQPLGKGFPTEAHPRGGMSISRSDIEWVQLGGWECRRVLINTGRNGIALYYFIIIVQDLKSDAWRAISGRVADEKGPDLLVEQGQVSLRWTDEHNHRPLAIHHRVQLTPVTGGISSVEGTPVYQLMYGYPVRYRFWADEMSEDPDSAEDAGWLAVAWEIVRTTTKGGEAKSERVSIPRNPGKQSWTPGNGGDVWFPVPGQVNFVWKDEVELRTFGKKFRRVSPEAAHKLASTNSWDVVLTREGDGTYRGAMLIENRRQSDRRHRSTRND